MYRQLNLLLKPQLTLAAVSFLLVKTAFAQVGLGLAPLRVEIKVEAGSVYSDSLAISNESSEPMRIHGENLDFFIDDDEQPQFRRHAVEVQNHSCREWIRINPAEFTLAPKEHKLIRYSMQFPAQLADGSYECALGFTTSPVSAVGLTGVVTNVRLVTALYATKGRPVIDGEVKSIQVVPGSNAEEKRRAILLLENRGTTYFRAVGSLDVLDAGGQVVESVPFRAIPVLPGRTQRFSFALKSSFFPAQKIRARFDIGSGEKQEVIADVTTPLPVQSPGN